VIIEDGADNVIGCAISTWVRRWKAIAGLYHKKAVSAYCNGEGHELISKAPPGDAKWVYTVKGVFAQGSLYVG
jgi:hypothetical protein